LLEGRRDRTPMEGITAGGPQGEAYDENGELIDQRRLQRGYAGSDASTSYPSDYRKVNRVGGWRSQNQDQEAT